MKLHSFYRSLFFISIIAVLLSTIFSLSVGPHGISFSSLLGGNQSPEAAFVVFELRLPRLLLAFAVGSILALSGLSYQSIFSNPIASPYTLGVSGGSAVGFVLGELFLVGLIPLGYGWILSSIGGGAVLFLLIPLLFVRSQDYTRTVLLVGVLISLFSGSILFFLQYFLDPAGLVELTGWYFGSLSIVGVTTPLLLLFLSVLLFYTLFSSASALDLLTLGSEYASSHGVDVRKLQAGIIGLTTLSIAFVVSVSGPIGFVGLIVPHFARVFVGNSHEKLVPVTFIVGGIFLVFSDLCSRLVGGTQEIPVGLVTALLGCPLMVALLLGSHRSQVQSAESTVSVS